MFYFYSLNWLLKKNPWILNTAKPWKHSRTRYMHSHHDNYIMFVFPLSQSQIAEYHLIIRLV